MNEKQKLIKSIYENGKESLELSGKHHQAIKDYNEFIEYKALDGVFDSYDEGFANDIAAQVILNLSEKDDLEDFFQKVKKMKKDMDKLKNDVNELNQKGFLMVKQGEEYSLENMGVDVIRVKMTSHPRWHKVQKDIEELTNENNLPVNFYSGNAYIATYPLNEMSPKEYLGSLLKKSKTKGGFFKAVVSNDSAISSLSKDELKSFVISNDTLLDLKNVQKLPKLFEENVQKALEEKRENKNTIKNSI